MSGRSLSVPMRYWVRGGVFFLSLAVLGGILKSTGAGDMFTAAWIDTHVRGNGLSGELIFVAIGAIFTAVGLPRQVVAFLGGYAFGLVAGTLWALVASIGGCILTFYYARFLGREFVLSHAPNRLKKADAFVGENTFNMALLIRLLPAGSNLFTSLAAGISSAGALAFFAGSALGYVPQTIVFALFGSGINLDPAFRISLSVVLFGASAGLGIYLFRKFRRNLGTAAPAD